MPFGNTLFIVLQFCQTPVVTPPSSFSAHRRKIICLQEYWTIRRLSLQGLWREIHTKYVLFFPNFLEFSGESNAEMILCILPYLNLILKLLPLGCCLGCTLWSNSSLGRVQFSANTNSVYHPKKWVVGVIFIPQSFHKNHSKQPFFSWKINLSLHGCKWEGACRGRNTLHVWKFKRR